MTEMKRNGRIRNQLWTTIDRRAIGEDRLAERVVGDDRRAMEIIRTEIRRRTKRVEKQTIASVRTRRKFLHALSVGTGERFEMFWTGMFRATESRRSRTVVQIGDVRLLIGSIETERMEKRVNRRGRGEKGAWNAHAILTSILVLLTFVHFQRQTMQFIDS